MQLLASLWLLDSYDSQYHARLSDFCWRFLTPLESPLCNDSSAGAGATASPPLAPATPAGLAQHSLQPAGAPQSMLQAPALPAECRCLQVGHHL